MTLWVSPLQDVFGFGRRYMIVAGVITFLGLAILLISDRAGSFYLWSLVARDDTSRLCNFSVVARLIFALSVGMELLTVWGVIFFAVHRRIFRSGQMVHDASAEAARLSPLRTGAAIAFGAMLLFLHLGLYGIAFGADDVCVSNNPSEIVHHYVALVAFALFYSLGALLVVGSLLLMLKRSLLAQ
jgi:hypothetical protein